LDNLRTYLITYTNGDTQAVTGKIVLFNGGTLSLPHGSGLVYLNANMVRSVVEKDNGGE
jgi:hypothetical protein